MKKILTACTLALGVSASASAAVAIPDTGVDTAGFITAGITTLGSVAAVAVGGYFAFLVIKKGIRWAGKAMG